MSQVKNIEVAGVDDGSPFLPTGPGEYQYLFYINPSPSVSKFHKSSAAAVASRQHSVEVQVRRGTQVQVENVITCEQVTLTICFIYQSGARIKHRIVTKRLLRYLNVLMARWKSRHMIIMGFT
jgi:hypothetical protein